MLRTKQQCTGLCLILLVLGGESARVLQNIDLNSYSSTRQRSLKQATVAKRAEHQSRNITEQHMAAEHAKELVMGLSLEAKMGEGIEVARGWISYKALPMCAVLRIEASHPGSGTLELYKMSDITEESFRALEPITIEPHRTLFVRADDAVALKKTKHGNKLVVSAEKRYFDGKGRATNYEKAGYRKTLKFSPVAEYFSVHLAGDDRWLDIGSADNAIDVWMNAIRMLQTIGTCLEEGTCLVQCTYLESKGGCNYKAFCNLEQEVDNGFKFARPRCKPKMSKDENMKGWRSFQSKIRKEANWILKTGCMASCDGSWKDVVHGTNLANQLRQQYLTIASKPKMMEHMPKETRDALEEISMDAEKWVETIASKVGRGFDFSRKNPFSSTKYLLASKGCASMPKGSMQALFHLNAVGDDDQEAQAEFQEYAESCPWIASLASGDDTDVRVEEDMPYLSGDIIDVDENATEVWVEFPNKFCASDHGGFANAPKGFSLEDCQKACVGNCSGVVHDEDSGQCFTTEMQVESEDECEDSTGTRVHSYQKQMPSSMLQLGADSSGRVIPVADILVVTAILSGVVVILAGVALVIRGALCKKGAPGETSSLAHKHCFKYLDSRTPCWHSHMLPGIYMMLGGLLFVAFTALATWAVLGGGAALLPGAWEWVVASGATSGGSATLYGLFRQIRSWFNTPRDTDPEEDYLKCMERLKDVFPEVSPNDNSHADSTNKVLGLDFIFGNAQITNKAQQSMHMDLIQLGVLNVKELELTDWHELTSWKALTKFEKRRMEEQIAALKG